MRTAKISAVLAAAAFIAAAGTPTASADSLDYCWLNAATNQSKCFATEAELVQSVAAKQNATFGTQAGVSPMAEHLVAQLYKDLNYGGGYLQIFDTEACKKGTIDGKNLPSSWDNKVSSFKVYGGCTVKLWEDKNYGGASTGWVGSMKYVGNALNDQISSFQWQKSV